LREFARAITRALPARNLAIVNGHGGNRGLLENLLHELRGDFGLNGCVMHPFDLAKVASSPAAPDIHGGKAETSLMLALAPALVRRELIEPARQPSDPDSLRAQIFDRGTTWPWRTDDPRLAHAGIIGDAQAATAEHGQALIDRIVAEARGVFARLRDNQKRL
jgi:creatinine amidohydrolase/Fe(II)-dependent formamide hydrolase-like protein